MTPSPIGAIILAAGRGRRFGADKRQHTLAGGDTLLASTIGKYRPVFSQLRIVLRPEDETLASSLIRQFSLGADEVVFAPAAHGGMGHSLAAAACFIDHWDAAVTALGDMPFVEADTLWRIVHALTTGAMIVQPRFEGAGGHPVGFNRQYFPLLRELEGDRGGRSIMEHHRERIQVIDTGDPGVLTDIDTPADVPGTMCST